MTQNVRIDNAIKKAKALRTEHVRRAFGAKSWFERESHEDGARYMEAVILKLTRARTEAGVAAHLELLESRC